MNFLITHHFFVQAKKLRNKFPNLKKDLIQTFHGFKSEKEIHIGKSIFKTRINSRDLNKGKSGGLRLYVYLFRKKDILVPVCIYSKSDKESVTMNELEYHFGIILGELSKMIF